MHALLKEKLLVLNCYKCINREKINFTSQNIQVYDGRTLSLKHSTAVVFLYCGISSKASSSRDSSNSRHYHFAPSDHDQSSNPQHSEDEWNRSVPSITVCLVLSNGNISLYRTVCILNHAYICLASLMPVNVQSSPVPVAIRKGDWKGGKCTVFRNILLIQLSKEL